MSTTQSSSYSLKFGSIFVENKSYNWCLKSYNLNITIYIELRKCVGIYVKNLIKWQSSYNLDNSIINYASTESQIHLIRVKSHLFIYTKNDKLRKLRISLDTNLKLVLNIFNNHNKCWICQLLVLYFELYIMWDKYSKFMILVENTCLN